MGRRGGRGFLWLLIIATLPAFVLLNRTLTGWEFANGWGFGVLFSVLMLAGSRPEVIGERPLSRRSALSYAAAWSLVGGLSLAVTSVAVAESHLVSIGVWGISTALCFYFALGLVRRSRGTL